MFDLTGKVAVVTGAAGVSGDPKAFAQQAPGGRVEPQEGCDEVAREINDSGASHRDRVSHRRHAGAGHCSERCSAWGRLDAVNNAPPVTAILYRSGSLPGRRTNIRGYSSRRSRRPDDAAGRRSIINIASINAVTWAKQGSSITKGANEHDEVFAAECGPDGIR
jgi:hypothetical protein